MSLYNMLFGVHPLAHILLRMLGTDELTVPRFRDCYIEGNTICIHTRTGGGNREEYECGNFVLTQLPGYLHDSDDSYDGTYANFYYAFPAEYADILKDIAEQSPTLPANEKWKQLLASMKTDGTG